MFQKISKDSGDINLREIPLNQIQHDENDPEGCHY